MVDNRPQGTHNPSQSATQRWENEGGAIKGVHAKRPRDPNHPAASRHGKEGRRSKGHLSGPKAPNGDR
jgi:hypothetical protein